MSRTGSDRYRKIEQLFEAALSIEPSKRADYLANACGDDEALKCEVQALLDADARIANPALQPTVLPGFNFANGDTLSDGAIREYAGSESVASDLELLQNRYDIHREIGRGAMGAVYLARHRALQRMVAIKIILPGRSTERFLRESRLLARLDSEHIVKVLDLEILPDDNPMLVMEWVDGTDLSMQMRQHGGSLPEETALTWMRHTCKGLLTAETQGIVHRDIKPSNILIDGKGVARVADFGLAVPVDSSLDPSLTATGTVMGTPLYMAPEQAEDPRRVDVRADIYSFGATWYHALTGSPPFAGSSPYEVFFKHKTEILVSPRARTPSLSEKVSQVIERCLAKSPQDRFQSFAGISQQLEPGERTALAWEVSDDPKLEEILSHYRERRDVYLSRDAQPGELDVFHLRGNRTLSIICGDITEQAVDAIVSSDDSYLTMAGGVSGAILRAAGREMRAEAQHYVPARPGRAIVTSGGKLPARFIFHGITLHFGVDDRAPVFPSRDLIAEIVESCLYHADSLHVRTIAFPLLGTGVAGFSRRVCLDTMVRVLGARFSRGYTSIRAARIMIYGLPLYQRFGVGF